jgi:hypothetical protein
VSYDDYFSSVSKILQGDDVARIFKSTSIEKDGRDSIAETKIRLCKHCANERFCVAKEELM